MSPSRVTKAIAEVVVLSKIFSSTTKVFTGASSLLISLARTIQEITPNPVTNYPPIKAAKDAIVAPIEVVFASASNMNFSTKIPNAASLTLPSRSLFNPSPSPLRPLSN